MAAAQGATAFQMVRISSFIMAIKFMYVITYVYNNAALQASGVSDFLTCVSWGVGGILGLLVIPLLGAWSDACKLSFGRRRPFVILTAVCVVIAMLLVSYGEQISMIVGLAPAKENTTSTPPPPGATKSSEKANKSNEHIPKDVFGFTIIFTSSAILFMFLTHSWSPSRAYIADASTSETATMAISIYTFMSCFGSILGGICGGIDWSFIPIARTFDDVYWWYYTVTIFVVVVAMLVCVTAYKEVPLKSKEALAAERAAAPKEENYKTFTASEEHMQAPPGRRKRRETVTKDIILTDPSERTEGFSFTGYCVSCCIMPRFMFVLYLCALSGVCWYSFYYIFLTDYIGKVVFKGDPSTPHNSILHDKYVEGIRKGSFCMAIDAASAACHAFLSMAIVEKVGIKLLYIGGQLCGITATFLMFFLNYVPRIYILSIFSGIMYSTIMTFPYLLLVRYHKTNVFKDKTGQHPSRKRILETDLAIFTSAYSISQVIAALFVSLLLMVYDTMTVALWSATGAAALGLIFSFFVTYLETDDDLVAFEDQFRSSDRDDEKMRKEYVDNQMLER